MHGDTATIMRFSLPLATINSIIPSPARFDNMEVTFNGSSSDSDGIVVAEMADGGVLPGSRLILGADPSIQRWLSLVRGA